MTDQQYDAIVIGTSQGGRFLPIELAKTGQKVALVERDQLGGVCGCCPRGTTPSTAIITGKRRRASSSRSSTCSHTTGTGIHHRWASELTFAPGGDTSSLDPVWLIWGALDVTPEGRGDSAAYPNLQY